jgi:steroid delta-isomerase-like uncharacterized protein
MSEQNKAVVDRVNELLDGGDAELVDELFAKDFVEHNAMPGFEPDRDGFKQLVTALHDAFPDFESEVHRQIAEDDVVVEHWTSTGTHEGELMGIPATGNTVTIEGIDILRIADGQVVERWTQMDSLGLLRQLGAIEDEAEPTEDEEDEEAPEDETADTETPEGELSKEETPA